MNGKTLINEFSLSASVLPGRYPSEGARWYIKRGKEIPDDLLPGRAITKLNHMFPGALTDLKSADMANVATWWIKIVCG